MLFYSLIKSYFDQFIANIRVIDSKHLIDLIHIGLRKMIVGPMCSKL